MNEVRRGLDRKEERTERSCKKAEMRRRDIS